MQSIIQAQHGEPDLSSFVTDSTLPCFAALGEQTANQLRERFQQGLTHAAVEEHVQRLIDTSLGSNWTRLYDSVRVFLRPHLQRLANGPHENSTSSTRSPSCSVFMHLLLRLQCISRISMSSRTHDSLRSDRYLQCS